MFKFSTVIISLGLLAACSEAPVRPLQGYNNGSGDAGVETKTPDANTDESNTDSNAQTTSGSTKDPVVTTKDPVTTTKDPVVTTKDPVTPTKDPVVTDPVKPVVTPSAALSADLMAKSSGRTKSSKTSMGTWFDKAVNVSISDADKKFLADPAQNVPVPDNKKSEWSYKKFTVNLYPSRGLPHPADAGQVAIGDCNMLAFLNSFAYQHPEFTKSLIKDRGNGTYDISMFDPKAQQITVSVDSNFLVDKSGNLIVVRGANNSAVWITVMEKAIMKYNQVYKIWNGDGPAKVEGFGSEAGAPMLTGEGDSYAFDRGALSKSSDLTRVVKEALKAGKLITGGFGVPMTINGLKSVTGHAYTVMVPPNDKTMIAMRNPWGFSPKADGGGDSSHDGILDIGFLDDWFKTIDLRIMEPGIAGGTGNTGPYQPRVSFRETGFTADDMEFMIEMHKGMY